MIGLAGSSLAPAPAGSSENETLHAENDVYQSLQRGGLTLSGVAIAFPAPLLRDGETPEAEHAVLRKLAGGEDALKELLRDSEFAPQILKPPRDVKASDGTIVRIVDLWFAVHAGLDDIDPARLGVRKVEAKPVEAANMKFLSTLLDAEELTKRGIERKNPDLEWYTHLTGDMLDRIRVEATDHTRATRAKDSWVFASRTDPRFDGDKRYPNGWSQVVAVEKAKGPAGWHTFAGGASTTKISRLVSAPGTLLVEAHFAYGEPRAWFDGEPVLRSKFALVAQNQIRQLRRELAKRKPPL